MRWKELKNNPQKLELLKKRSHLINFVREFFLSREFIECDTPELVKYPGMEPYLTPFETSVSDAVDNRNTAYLITSPEYSMKKILAAGLDKIFQISKVFRNHESFGGTHNPEFTMIEWYRAGADYTQIMRDTEELILSLVIYLSEKEPANFQFPISPDFSRDPDFLIINNKMEHRDNFQLKSKNLKIKYQNQTIDLTTPWPRISVAEAFEQFASVKLSDIKPKDNEQYEDVFWKIFLNEVEPKLKELGRPVFIYDYPIELGALAKAKDNNPDIAERFELYIGGLELANAFSELMNGTEQRKRLMEEQALRQKLNKSIFPIDEDFIAALNAGPTTAAGIALGLDRLIMLLLDQKDINEILWFGAKDLF